MKIDNIIISNFRGIQNVEASNLGDTIIVAGQNGSGKSCIFDAIRLLKSTYGGYQQNEWQHFFGEFQIQLHGNAKNLQGLFNDARKPVEIECHFRLRNREKAYIIQNLEELLSETIWQRILPEAFQYGGYHKALFSNQFRERAPEVKKQVSAEMPALKQELAQDLIIGRVAIKLDGNIIINNSTLLSVIFSNYRPREIGVVDFHGAQRHYGRENVQGINLSLDQAKQTYSQHTLYNYNNKYNNVKSEMAGNFIKELLAEKSGSPELGQGASLIDTLKELFEAFFPEKKFNGPRPTRDGSLSFPVITQGGSEHDLDELSSGEKEILYGYLRIRSSAPQDSIILLDEPELHLNPRLIRGLPEFYRKHLGEALQNQLWLVTHSDALLREAVGKPGFNVYHMLPCGSDGRNTQQLRPLIVSGDLDLVLADLVGDLAAYRPGGKGLIFEGGGDSDFDKTMSNALFPDELRGINLISGTNKARVRALHEILEKAYIKGDLPTKFYAIVDKDFEESQENPAVNTFEWNVYHIENYLLESKMIGDVLKSIDISRKIDYFAIEKDLESAARRVVPSMLIQRMQAHVNSRIVRSINLGFSPDTLTVGRELYHAVSRSIARINDNVTGELSEAAILNLEQKYRADLEKGFADGSWKSIVPGREILKKFVSNESITIGYEAFRNLIVSHMAQKGYKPAGMAEVINKIKDA